MRSGLRAALAALLLLPAMAPAAQQMPQNAREKWDTKVLALIPKPGFPAHAYVSQAERIYAGTYDNPSGDTVPSRVFEYLPDGTLLHSWTIKGQDLSQPHGVQAATGDVLGRLVLLDKSPPRALLLDLNSGKQKLYASFPAGSIPNYAAWGPDASLYVTDYGQPIIWRIPPGGGEPQKWLEDPRLDGAEFGATGLELMADRKTLLVGMQSEGGGAAGNPATGRLWKVPIGAGGKAGEMEQLWESGPAEGPDGFAIAQSGAVYVTLLVANQIAQVGADGQEVDRFPDQPGSGANGSSVPFDSPSSASFLGTRLIVAQQSYVTGDAAHQAILDVEAGERGLPEFIPPGAGTGDLTPARIRRLRIDGRRISFRVSEAAIVEVKAGQRRTVSFFVLGKGPYSEEFRLPRGRWKVKIGSLDLSQNRSKTIVRKVRVR